MITVMAKLANQYWTEKNTNGGTLQRIKLLRHVG